MKQYKFLVGSLLLLCLGLWHFTKTPSNDREWALDQQQLPYAEFAGDRVTIFNIRNFTYQSTTNFEPNYYDKTFNIHDLQSVYYIVEPFGSIGAAHTFVSFGFGADDYLAISVEIRREVGESFSPIRGLLRSYELMYVVADERDVVQLRTNYRKNDVYIYPVITTTENMRELFIDMLHRANTLKQEPEFYNTLTNNCTTNIAQHVNTITPSRIPWDPRLLFPENSDELAYELGLLDNSVSLSALRQRYLVTEKARQYTNAPDFSARIRQ